MKKIIYLLLILTSCDATTRISSIENKSQKVRKTTTQAKTELDSFLIPYRAQLEKTMHDTLAYSVRVLSKKKVESTLGNWVADGMLWYANEKLEENADLALCNAGGLRVKSLPAGPILVKHIFELMPFENELVLMDVDSSELKTILERVADKEGWPVSKGFYLLLSKENKILDWKINGIRKAHYKLILSDYIATGGDGMSSLIQKPRKNLNIRIRDVLIQYAKHQVNLHAQLEGRIVKEHTDANEQGRD